MHTAVVRVTALRSSVAIGPIFWQPHERSPFAPRASFVPLNHNSQSISVSGTSTTRYRGFLGTLSASQSGDLLSIFRLSPRHSPSFPPTKPLPYGRVGSTSTVNRPYDGKSRELPTRSSPFVPPFSVARILTRSLARSRSQDVLGPEIRTWPI